jgi:CheY-like chemotaxis protein
VAHDFNNLLTLMSGAFDLIERIADEPERVRQWARRGQEAGKQGAGLTQRLLGFVRREEPRQQVVDPASVLRDLQPLLRQAMGVTADLELRLGEGLHAVRMNVAAFEAAILNLVVNARDAMPGGGTIGIGAENVVQERASGDLRSGDYVRVEVRDHGIGMDPEVLEKATEPFFTTKQKGTGTGLGLSQVRNFTRMVGGAMRIESAKGTGSSVQLYLPKALSASAQEQRAAPAPAPPLRTARAGESVLVVDDDPPVRDLAVDTLKSLGYRVLEAASGPDALTVLHGGEPIDFLFSDIVMPGGMNGVELAVKARQVRPGIKVVLTSGYADGAARDIPKDVPLLPKPYTVEQLSGALR